MAWTWVFFDHESNCLGEGSPKRSKFLKKLWCCLCEGHYNPQAIRCHPWLGHDEFEPYLAGVRNLILKCPVFSAGYKNYIFKYGEV